LVSTSPQDRREAALPEKWDRSRAEQDKQRPWMRLPGAPVPGGGMVNGGPAPRRACGGDAARCSIDGSTSDLRTDHRSAGSRYPYQTGLPSGDLLPITSCLCLSKRWWPLRGGPAVGAQLSGHVAAASRARHNIPHRTHHQRACPGASGCRAKWPRMPGVVRAMSSGRTYRGTPYSSLWPGPGLGSTSPQWRATLAISWARGLPTLW